MAIVLPRRRKQGDIFAPSKAIQDAKTKIGPAFFDVTLLECSRNAVELNKLVNQWELLEREKVKLLKYISHEQGLLIRSLQKYQSKENDKTKSIYLAETKNTPGFRFRSNGDIRASSKSAPILHITDEEKDEQKEDSIVNSTGRKPGPDHDRRDRNVLKQRSDYESINYENEINELESVIKDICNCLVKLKVSLTHNASGGNIKTFLRAHTNEYVPLLDSGKADMNNFAHPNDRFAFKPGSSCTRDTYLHKHKIKTPSHRSCIGCQIRLKQEHEGLTRMKRSQSESLSKRRWSYVPQGKYVQSTTALHTTTSFNDRKSSQSTSNKESTFSKTSKSMVHFATGEKHELPRRAFSVIGQKAENSPSTVIFKDKQLQGSISQTKPKSCLSVNTNKVEFDQDLPSSKSINVLGLKSGIDFHSDKTSIDRRFGSSLSCRSPRESSAKISCHFVDHESRLNILKAIQVSIYLFKVFFTNGVSTISV